MRICDKKSLKPQAIFYQRKLHFLFHAVFMSELVYLRVHWENNLNKSPPTESTYSQRRDMDLSNSFGHQFYHPQCHNIGKNSNHDPHQDSWLLHTSSLSSLLFDSILDNASAAWPKGGKIHCHLFLSSAELLLGEANLSFHLNDCVWLEWWMA